MGQIGQQHQIHGVQPVLPVTDVQAAAQWFVQVLGFDIDFLHGDAPHVHGRVKIGDGRWGDPVYIHLTRCAGEVATGSQIRLHVGHDIDGLHAHVLAQLPLCSGVMLSPPTNQPWGLREFSIKGPGGHVLVLGAEIAPR